MQSVPTTAKKSTTVCELESEIIRAISDSLPARGTFRLREELFGLARRLKDTRRAIDAEALDVIANEWYRLMGERAADEEPSTVRAVLKKAFAKCRYGFNDPTLASEFTKRRTEPLSEAALQFTRNPKVREAVIACEAAARLHGGGEFPLSQRRLGQLLGESQQRAGERLATLIEAGVIVEVRGYVKGKWPKSYRLVVKAAESVAEKVRRLFESLRSVAKLLAGSLGKSTASNVPGVVAEPEESAKRRDESERGWWEPDPNQPAYDPNAHKPATTTGGDCNETHKRDGPKKLRLWPRMTPLEEIQRSCFEERKKVTRVEPEPI